MLPRNPPRNLAVALVATSAIGLALRIVSFLSRPSVGLDEARLALNIASRPYGGLFPPLDHDQSAPLLFLWAEKLMTDLFGMSDLALRVVPLAAGIGALLLTYPVFRRFVSAPGAAVGTAMVAFAPVLVYYSTGVKQYGVEVFTTLVLLKLTLDRLETPRAARVDGPLLAVGVLAVWVSTPAIFVLVGIVGSLCCLEVLGGDRHPRRLLVRAIPLWVASFVLAYVFWSTVTWPATLICSTTGRLAS